MTLDAPLTGRDPIACEAILANALLVLPDRVERGWIAIAGGRIAEIGEGDAVPAGATDCGGDLLAPGLVELHTDNLERHLEPRPRVDWPHAPAIIAHDAELAGGGITTVFDALRVGSIVHVSGAEKPYARGVATEIAALRREGALRIEHRLHLRAEVCSETLLEELAEFGPEDGVGLLSLMDHTPGQRQFRDMSQLRAYVMGKHGLSEEEFQAHVAGQQALRARVGERHERGAVEAARRLGAVLASHDDSDREQVALSAAHGARIAEFPTTLEAAEACRAAGIAVMMGAPNLIRGGSHSGNVAAADLAEAGLLDIVSSDYVPAALLQSAFALARIWDGDLARGFACVTEAPARAAGLADRGALRTGLRADLVRVAERGGHPLTRGVWCAGRRVA
ncbi:alpha-D-ribose 1-methylphosphonate 5-triphosphate diphosphatase [Rubellimicrobium sp. CFH 75288]|uniref:alpha-D-ribose 1-methylphosphonate 5-triphosphate diphosphatase n=1 Tax=Rubellimicrobium sp. CFH 75288 TaxID=2697034 RepID=UPI001412E4B4|nr:alpha-D-ribose 1-methylphosphonate 5-triphosphate diphosphatase [Rubellimicrobium sp. CFH 75288]NAZ36482.1 alpha-D-ribose 1-methylphosphonate 5-triphosphate diphosphatase [Rubellimicrobium sp. CFH 75288]